MGRRDRIWKFFGFVVLGLSLVLKTDACLAAPEYQEYQVKAAFLYNFAKFVEWPTASFRGPEEPLVLAVLGKDPFGKALETVKGKNIEGRPFVVKRFESVEEIGRCHLVFISPSERDSLPQILKSLQGREVLTVSEVKGFSQSGGMINFYTEDNKIRFEINPEAAQRAGLKISSQLLKLARIYKEKN